MPAETLPADALAPTAPTEVGGTPLGGNGGSCGATNGGPVVDVDVARCGGCNRGLFPNGDGECPLTGGPSRAALPKLGGPTPTGLLLAPKILFGDPGPAPLVGPPWPEISGPNALGRLKVPLLDGA